MSSVIGGLSIRLVFNNPNLTENTGDHRYLIHHAWGHDLGDSREHRLTATDVRAGNPEPSYPRYVGGFRNAPSEDCGGIPGFYDMLDVLADPSHPSYAGATEWADEYDPDTIDELPIKYALLRIANRRNTAKVRLTKSTRSKSDN